MKVTLNDVPSGVVAFGWAFSAGDALAPLTRKIEAPPKLPATVNWPPTGTERGSTVTTQLPWANALPPAMMLVASPIAMAVPSRRTVREWVISPAPFALGRASSLLHPFAVA